MTGSISERHQFASVKFHRFKAFKEFSIDLKHFNILVGPNNAGKSTVLAAFRILAAALRKASARKAIPVRGPYGTVLGHDVELSSISIAEENIFYNYHDSEVSEIVFRLSNKNTLTLYFPEQGTCLLIPDAQGKQVSEPSNFKKQFNCPIGFVPILGPVEHHEPLYEKEAARLALFNYRAARNFRNIWYHYPEKFDLFRDLLRKTWLGMDILRPELDTSHTRARLHMYCPEQRIPRELFWSGFGFQVWCQMLTHLIQSNDVSLFLIDEPDIYLHSELQRQLLGLLKHLGPDILIATHSTEIIIESETDDILLINKDRRFARRLKSTAQLEEVFNAIGSNINPILTQLAKTRRALFVEGNDFQILGKFARKLGEDGIGNRRDFAVVPVDGFNPERIRALKAGMEVTLGTSIVAAAILDRDYRCDAECLAISKECCVFCDFVWIHKVKEIENFLLVPEAIDRAVGRKVSDRARRSGTQILVKPEMTPVIDEYCESRKSYIMSQFVAEGRRFERINSPGVHESKITELVLDEFGRQWTGPESRRGLVSGKDCLSAVNKHTQDKYCVNVTSSAIIDAMYVDEISKEIIDIVGMLKKFSTATHDVTIGI